MARRKVILAGLLIAAAGVLVYAWPAGTTRPLTEEETLGAVFAGTTDTNLMPIYHHANPAALATLREWLKHGEIAEYHYNIITMLGQIGDASDAQRIEDYILALAGDIHDKPEREAFSAGLYALAAMGRRGIASATDRLGRMTEVGYWAKVRLVIFPAEHAPEMWDLDEKVSYAFTAYAAAGAPDFAARHTAWLNGLPTKDQRKRYGVDVKERAKYPDYMRKSENEAIPNDIRRELPKLFNGSMTAPGRAGRPSVPPPAMSMPARPPEVVAERSLVIGRLVAEVPKYSAAALVQYASDWRQGARSTAFVKQVPPETKGDLYRVHGLITLYKPVYGVGDLPASEHVDAELRDPTASETSEMHLRLHALADVADENAQRMMIVLYKGGGWLDGMFVGPIPRAEYRQAAEAVGYIRGHPANGPAEVERLAKSENVWLRELGEHFRRHPG